MARNVEIKARIGSVEAMLPLARSIAGDSEPLAIVQDDTFFAGGAGRLKLRVRGDSSAELIAYRRPDSRGPALSDYRIVPVTAPDALRDVLARAYGIAGRVRKRRLLLHAGQTRIHLDRVEGLGDFVELEVVLREEQTEADGAAIAESLMAPLGLRRDAFVRGAYVDLLGEPRRAAATLRLRAAALVLRGGDVLLQRAGPDRFWALPGGRVEAGETAEAALRRELREELGVDCSVGRHVWTVENLFQHRGERVHELGLYFACSLDAASPLLDTAGPHAGIEVAKRLTFDWFPRGRLHELDFRPRVLAAAIAGDLAMAHFVQTEP